jgi:MFS family permease
MSLVMKPFVRDVIPPAGVVRILAVSNLVKTIAHGIIMTVSIVYFTGTVGIPAAQVGLALTAGAAMGMLVGVPAGRAADTWGPRGATVWLLVLMGLSVAGYALVGGFATLLVVTALVLMCESASNATHGALVAGLVVRAERTRALAYLRSTQNLGVSIGAVVGGLALHIDTRPGYVAILLGSGAGFVVAGLTFLRAPRVAPPSPTAAAGPAAPKAPRWEVLRDRPYGVVSLLNAVLIMNSGILLVALPIWIAHHTNAPVVLYAVILLLNTVVVILFQVRAARGTERPAGGARALRRSGLLLAASCAVFALAAGRPAWLAIVILLAGALVHVLGEILYSAGAWSLAFGLAPDRAMGQYQGVFEMSTQLGTMVTPLLVTTLIIGFGGPGWLGFAAVLLAAGLAAPRVTDWAERTREPEPAVSRR